MAESGWYRRQGPLVEAYRWFGLGDGPDGVVRAGEHGDPSGVHALCGYLWGDHGVIEDVRGARFVCPGQWLVRGVDGWEVWWNGAFVMEFDRLTELP